MRNASIMKKELLFRVSRGEPAAFTDLFKLYQSKVYTVALAVARSPDAAEELVQEVFLNIWVNREKLAGISNFEAYLFIITRNAALHTIKKIAREREMLLNVKKESVYTGSGNETEQRIYNREYQVILNKALARLSPQQQSVFQLIQEQGLSRKEVALRLHISPESVKTHFSRAMKNIRSLFVSYQAG